MVFSNVIVDVTVPRRSSVFSQSSVQISAGLTDISVIYFDYCSPLWDTCGKQLKDKLQKNQNRAGRVITGSSYDVRSIDVLDNLKWKTLETRRFHAKATVTLMYKILNDLSAPQLSNSFVKLNDTNINYNLRNIETDLALPRPYTNFLKRSFRYSDAMLWNNLSYEACGFQT